MKPDKSKIRKILGTAAAAGSGILITVFSRETSASVVNSIHICVNAIIPSMFAFMAISSYIISSGLYRYISAPFYFILKKVIRLDRQSFSIFILSLIGGYPTGIKLISEITAQNKNYSAIAEKLSAICYCVSPPFAITMLGLGIFGSEEAGVIIYISNVLACLTAAIVFTRIFPIDADNYRQEEKSGGLIAAVNGTAASLITVCAVIVAFNVLLTAFQCVMGLFSAEIPCGILGLFEISNLLKIQNPSASLLPFVSAASSFGGVCVLVQCAALTKNQFSLKYFLAVRLPCAALSGFFASVIMNFWEISVTASPISASYSFVFSAERAVTLLLTVMCILIFLKNEKIFKKV
ncbi:MAG: hypothetical protein ACI4J4_08735 [Ruminiclostridium sp.]